MNERNAFLMTRGKDGPSVFHGEPFMIYVHVPFCPKKCGYCDFYSGPAGEAAIRAYFEELRKEIRENPFARPVSTGDGERRLRVSSVFIGGGTPSYVPAEEIASILELLRDRFEILPDAEITMEANPGSLTAENSSNTPCIKAGQGNLRVHAGIGGDSD